MDSIEKILEVLVRVDGFVCAAAYTSGGELIHFKSFDPVIDTLDSKKCSFLLQNLIKYAKNIEIGYPEILHFHSDNTNILIRFPLQDDKSLEKEQGSHWYLLKLHTNGNIALGRKKLQSIYPT